MAQKRQKPSLAAIITQMKYPLLPLYPLPCGDPHPNFPATLLQFHLLTEEQLDSIAQYYHQSLSPPEIWTYSYPSYMNWNSEFLEEIGKTDGELARINAKRRKVGKFIGLRDCETPREEVEQLENWERKRREAVFKNGFVFRN